MLGKILMLKKSLSDEQFEEVSKIIGPNVYELFRKVLGSENEEEAQTHMKKFSDALGEQPIAAFKLYNKLKRKQKDIILELMEDESG